MRRILVRMMGQQTAPSLGAHVMQLCTFINAGLFVHSEYAPLGHDILYGRKLGDLQGNKPTWFKGSVRL